MMFKEKFMFERKKINSEITRKVKMLIQEQFDLSEDTLISLSELNCHEPSCPPKETVITTRAINGESCIWRIAKPMSEINIGDIKKLEN
tara:strand:+ start:445 stop:711 length:267 start_codon:yes stop_codon:yes gene_type:complete